MSIDKPERGMVDAFEGEWARVIMGEPGYESAQIVPRARLPEDTRVGDVMRVWCPKDVPLEQAAFQFDEQETAEARRRIRSKLDRLRQRQT
ncbi:DUF3006 domain-containing protein [Thioalkalivibrio sp. ALE11]|uniref:DUF3006 domain-containing protein n=1 Tax=Thioalkalivibrio sp. ALE11 TaxID=1265494 RepID=UPI001E60DB46|nr:DUF3006 domain-containing protein [Thioalkalivibrio sp. ALE11]